MALLINEISFYQLENLILQRVPFHFINIANEEALLSCFIHINPYFQKFLKDQLRTVASLEKAQELIKENQFSIDTPLVLICENGEISKKLAEELEQKAFKNVYVIAGGLKQLISDTKKT